MQVREVQLTSVRTRRHELHPSYHIIVQIHTDTGLTGIGEMPDLSHAPAIMPDLTDLQACLNQVLVGQRPEDINHIQAILLDVFPGTRFYGKASLIRCGIDIAVWDLLGRSLARPVCELLGGRLRERVAICYPIFRMTTEAQVEQNLDVAARRLAEGFSSFRVYVGKNPAIDEAFFQAFTDRFGNQAHVAAIDASGLLTAKQATALWKRLKPFSIDLFESPVPRTDIHGMAEVRAQVDIPISEHIHSPEFALELIKHRAVDIFNISVSVAGGITPARRLLELADMANLACLIGTTQETSIATAALAHLGASCPRLDYHSDPVGPLIYIDDICQQRVRYQDGCMIVPSGPGLGVELDPDQLDAAKAPLTAAGDISAAYVRG